MKTRQRSSWLLSLEERSWPYPILLGCGLLFSAVVWTGGATLQESLKGLAFVSWWWVIPLLLTRFERLTFDRESGLVTLTSRSIWSRTAQGFPLRRVVEARVEVESGGDGDWHRLQVRLTDPPETLAPVTFCSFRGEPALVAQVVNGWLRQGQ